MRRSMHLLAEIAGDAILVATTSAYARWLDSHKGLEPDFTWLEVAIGVALCLIHAAVRTRLDQSARHEEHTIRAFAIGSAPIITGEIAQWLYRRRERRIYLASRQ